MCMYTCEQLVLVGTGCNWLPTSFIGHWLTMQPATDHIGFHCNWQPKSSPKQLWSSLVASFLKSPRLDFGTLVWWSDGLMVWLVWSCLTVCGSNGLMVWSVWSGLTVCGSGGLIVWLLWNGLTLYESTSQAHREHDDIVLLQQSSASYQELMTPADTLPYSAREVSHRPNKLACMLMIWGHCNGLAQLLDEHELR